MNIDKQPDRSKETAGHPVKSSFGAVQGAGLIVIAGWVGILDGLCAFWLGMALLLNPMGPREIIPLVPYPYGRRR